MHQIIYSIWRVYSLQLPARGVLESSHLSQKTSKASARPWRKAVLLDPDGPLLVVVFFKKSWDFPKKNPNKDAKRAQPKPPQHLRDGSTYQARRSVRRSLGESSPSSTASCSRASMRTRRLRHFWDVFFFFFGGGETSASRKQGFLSFFFFFNMLFVVVGLVPALVLLVWSKGRRPDRPGLGVSHLARSSVVERPSTRKEKLLFLKKSAFLTKHVQNST